MTATSVNCTDKLAFLYVAFELGERDWRTTQGSRSGRQTVRAWHPSVRQRIPVSCNRPGAPRRHEERTYNQMPAKSPRAEDPQDAISSHFRADRRSKFP